LQKRGRIVRKEFKRSNGIHGNYENELHNLNLLNNLKHPNIVKLLSSYTYRGKHNFLFPLAQDGDLTTFLTQKDRPYHFLEDGAYYRALGELSSAIEVVHNYTSDQLNLDLLGIHHDLKPQNILVHEGTFILADFGLSKFKEATESSKTMFNIGGGHYLAPECEDYEANFEKHTINRSSDVWSFGCIIAEILTYMVRGVDGVAEFKRRRLVKVGILTTCAFHAGRDKPNAGVTAWLTKLKGETAEPGQMASRLIESMLSMEPERRPKAGQVTSRLRFIAMNAYIDSIDGQYDLLSGVVESLELEIERQRFKSWKWAIRSSESQPDPWNYSMDAAFKFQLILKHLVNIQQELGLIVSRCQHTSSPLFLDLRILNDRLLALLPWEIQERATTHLELHMMQAQNATLLAETPNAFENSAFHRKIAMLATIKRMNLLVSERSQIGRPDLHHGLKSVQIEEPFENHSIGTFSESHESSKRRVLVEWMRYGTHWEGQVSEEMFARVEAIAELLNSPTKPDGFRVLKCAGYFHDPSNLAFGFIYEFPSNPSTQQRIPTPRSLANILDTTQNIRERPSLNDRFKLACALTVSLLEFHKVGWMHKSLSAYNVAFFVEADSHPRDWLKEPYVVGFNRSRPDEPTAFTEGPNMDLKFQTYQHPEYQKDRARFRPDFDFYSLGLVLLEIGLWKPLEEVIAKLNVISREDLPSKLLERRVPLLSHMMGVNYYEAVRACISGIPGCSPGLEEDLMTEERYTLLLNFEKLVVERIGKCSV
jgi:serine/threonine protein kinase